MIRGVIFDMDGLLIDSEPFWQEIESELFSKVTKQTITKQMIPQTMGMRIDEVVAYWHQKYPWESPTQKEVVAEVVTEVIKKVKAEGKARPGVYEVLNFVKEKGIPMAIASSSYAEIIDAVVEKLSLQPYMKVTHSAQHELYGKPHPGVYLTTAEMLAVSPKECLVFEDAPSGVVAAKAAQMTCIVIPDHVKEDKRFCIADYMLTSLEEFPKLSII